jgi:hypothetical protein
MQEAPAIRNSVPVPFYVLASRAAAANGAIGIEGFGHL